MKGPHASMNELDALQMFACASVRTFSSTSQSVQMYEESCYREFSEGGS